MAWTIEGTYFENCSCDTICPCAWSGLTAKATHDRCYAMLAFHVDRGYQNFATQLRALGADVSRVDDPTLLD